MSLFDILICMSLNLGQEILPDALHKSLYVFIVEGAQPVVTNGR